MGRTRDDEGDLAGWTWTRMTVPALQSALATFVPRPSSLTTDKHDHIQDVSANKHPHRNAVHSHSFAVVILSRKST